LFSEELIEKITFRRCASQDTIIPNSKVGESFVLPDIETFYELVKKMME
jgi:hypothetical protein